MKEINEIRDDEIRVIGEEKPPKPQGWNGFCFCWLASLSESLFGRFGHQSQHRLMKTPNKAFSSLQMWWRKQQR